MPALRLGGLRPTWYGSEKLSRDGRLTMSTKVSLLVLLLGVLASGASVSACQMRASEEPAAQGGEQMDEEEQQEDGGGGGGGGGY